MWHVLVALCIFSVVIKSPVVKGYFGELFVRMWLSRLDKEKYTVVNDIMIPTNDGGTTQIDHIVVSNFGIFVIETKNYKGWIFGNEHNKYWTQVIYRNKNKFYNPVLQNKGHVKALKNLLESKPDLNYIPIVVFTSRADFKKLEVESHVVYSMRLVRTIRKYTEATISSAELKEIVGIIQEANNTDKAARKEHINYVKEKSAAKIKSEPQLCPLCGSPLVKKKGKYGWFEGCSKYPECRYIQKKKAPKVNANQDQTNSDTEEVS